AVNGVIPGVGMIFGTKQANVFGGVHVGFAPPRVTSSISPNGLPPPDVHAEKSLNYELGSRVGPTKWLRLEAPAFLSDYSTQVVVGTEPGGDANLTDAGATNVYGLESGGLLSFDKLLRLPPALILELGARYTYSHATFRHGQYSGNFLPYAPEH